MESFKVEKVVEGVHALAVWDASWDSYNNCYILLADSHAVLIDSGKREHTELLIQALAQVGRRPEDVIAVLATHGHRDHVGGSIVFPKASKLIHRGDWGLLSPELRPGFVPGLPDEAERFGCECQVLGQHTAGSVAFFHRTTKVLFSGDHVCFFGAPLLAEGLVGRGDERRERFRAIVSEWARTWPPQGQELERMIADLGARSPEDQERYNLDLFLQGVARLQRLDSVALCTGHGPVLVEDIVPFLSEVESAGRR